MSAFYKDYSRPTKLPKASIGSTGMDRKKMRTLRYEGATRLSLLQVAETEAEEQASSHPAGQLQETGTSTELEDIDEQRPVSERLPL